MTSPRIPHLRRRAALRLLVVATAALGAIAAVAAPASAHPALLYTTPAAETADPAPPSSMVLVFGEPVTIAASAVTVTDATGRLVLLNAPTLAKDGHAVTAVILQTLPAGVYTVAWRVTGGDGDLVEGRFQFAVGTAITAPSTVDNDAQGGPWPVTLLRFVLLAGLTLATGGMIIELLVRRAQKVNPALPEVDTLGGIGAIAGAAAAAALSVRYAAQTGDLGTPATIAAVQAAAFVIIVVAQALRRNGITILALAVITVAETLRAHPNVALPGGGAVLTYVHVTAAALWAGTLIHVVRTARAWRAHPGAVRWLHSYARLAFWAAAFVIITGCLAALLLAPPQTWATTGYGRLLLAKAALVLAAVILALAARRKLRHSNDSALPVLRPAKAEATVLGAVLVITAMLTTAAPPQDPAAGQLPPPAPVGLVLPLGSLAGQIGMAIEASEGRLVVRLSTPSRDDYYTTTPVRQRFTLTGRLLTASSSEPVVLRFRGCGNGCYVTDVTWGTGDNLLTLRALAGGWQGGTTSIVIAWPVADGISTLRQAVMAMRALPEVRFTETVTSDTSRPTPEPVQLRLPASEFLALQPYDSGLATHVALLPSGDGWIRLALGYPAEGRYIQLTLDDRHRILDEIQSDPKHLTIRHYLY